MKRKNIIQYILHILLYVVSCIFLLILIGIAVSLPLRTTGYTVELDGIQQDITIVFLSDLHSDGYGSANSSSSLLKKVRGRNPDLIALVGDMFSRTSTEEEIADVAALAAALTEIAPVYYSFGNHEQEYISVNGDAVLEQFRQSGVTILNDEFLDLEIKGTAIRLGGMDRMAYTGGNGKYDPEARAFLNEYCASELPKIMLSHRPEFFAFMDACKTWDIDLILSGHTHGGLVRLPFIGGLYAPIQGWLPKTDYGEYIFFGTRMIVTSGLAGYGRLPRIFNPPEICAVTITKAD